MEKWPSLTMDYLDKLIQDNPDKYHFMVSILSAQNEKQKKEIDKAKNKGK